MSKIKIQGNASGTGVVTLIAPNTNTDKTITLPDSTGTVLMTDGDGSSLTGTGKVLQSIFSYTDTEVVQAATASHIQIGLSATITPKSTTSLIDLSALIYSIRTATGGYGAYVYRNGVNITTWVQQGSTYTGSFTNYATSLSMDARESIQWTFAQLGTGVAETYDIRVDVYVATHQFQSNLYTGVTAGTASTMRLMEIEV